MGLSSDAIYISWLLDQLHHGPRRAVQRHSMHHAPNTYSFDKVLQESGRPGVELDLIRVELAPHLRCKRQSENIRNQ